MIFSRAVLASSSISPVAPFAVPPVVPPGSPGSRPARLIVPRPVPRPVATSRVSSRHLIRSSRPLIVPSRHPRRSLSRIYGGGLATAGGGQRGRRRAVFFFRAPFSSAHYHSPHHQVRIIRAASDRCGFDGAVSTVSSHHLIRLSSHSSPIAVVSSRNEGGSGIRFFFKQATASHGIHPVMSSSSSSHHYLTVERLARRLVMKRLAWASRLDIPGASTGDGEDKDKQANTKEQG